MPLVPAICTQCGSRLEIDSSKEAAVCPYCETPFVVEKAINNYKTTNIVNIDSVHADVLKVTDDNSRDNRVRSGETFIKLNDYVSAENVFTKLTNDCPYDYRGWWGLVRVFSHDFGDFSLDRQSLLSVDQLYKKAIVVAAPEEQKTIEPQYRAYYDSVTKKLDISLQNVQSQMADLTTEYDSYVYLKKEKIGYCSEQIAALDKTYSTIKNVLIIFTSFIVVILVVDTIIESGFGWGIAALFLCGAIAYFICAGICGLFKMSFDRKKEPFKAMIGETESELKACEAEYVGKMNHLTEIEKRVK